MTLWWLSYADDIETHSGNLKNISYETACGMYGSAVLERTIPLAPEIVVCWGNAVPMKKRHRISAVMAHLVVLKRPEARVMCFGLSKDGNPLHPLRLAYDTKMVQFELVSTRPSRRDE